MFNAYSDNKLASDGTSFTWWEVRKHRLHVCGYNFKDSKHIELVKGYPAMVKLGEEPVVPLVPKTKSTKNTFQHNW